MLDISKPLTTGKVRSYYRQEYSAASNSYFSQNGTLQGRWHERLVPVLGLSDAVTAEAFDRLAEGQHPLTGEQLIRHRPPAEEGPEPRWLKNGVAWNQYLQEMYIAAISEGRSVLLGADALPAPKWSREIRSEAPREYSEREKTLIEMHAIAAKFFQGNLAGNGGAGARDYLAGRSVNAELAAEFHIGVAPRGNQLVKALSRFGPEMMEASGLFYKTESGRLMDRFMDRVMIPIQDSEGHVIAFAGRSLTDNPRSPKYVNSPETEIYKKTTILFNAHRAANRAQMSGKVIAVEGYMDAIAAHAAGVPAVALGGTAMTSEQARRLGSMAETVVLNMDTDDAGQRATKRNIEALISAGIPIQTFAVPDKKDAAEYIGENGADRYRAAVETADDAIRWLALDATREVIRKYGPNPDSRAYTETDAIRSVISVLEKAPEAARPAISKQLAAFLGQAPEEGSAEQKSKPLEHRAGWDLTFNAPKTVSLTALVGGDERVREAHQFAVTISLDIIERYVQARMGGNRPAETTEKWIAAIFDHDTARPVNGYPAPHLHTHVVVFNMTEDETGRARSLQPYELFKVQSLATAVYQNELAWRLRSLGYEISRGMNHAPDIKGYTPEYLAHESLRTAEIKGQLEELGLNGREAESILKHQNREGKLRLPPDELRELHRTHAEAHGNQPDRVVTEALGRWHQIEIEEKISARSSAAVNFARDRLSERNSVFDHFELLRDALRHGRGRVRVEQIEDEIRRQWQDGRFIEVDHVRRHAPGHRFTTAELVRTERETIERVLSGRGTVSSLPLSLTTVTTQFASLNEEQRKLIYLSLTGTDQVIGVQGSAGTGKTTTLRAIRELAEESGFRTHGLGTSSPARKGLTEAGIDSETIHAYIARGGQRFSEDGQPVLFFLDESSLASSRQMHRLLQTIQPRDRVLIVGDRRQHQSIEAGRAFEQLQDAGMKVISLDRIVRQKNESLRKVVEALQSGQVKPAVEILEQTGRIHEIEHRKRRFEAIAEDYASSPAATLVISPDNNSRQALNAAIRTKLRETGKIGEDAAEMRIMITRQDVTGADRAIASAYRVGDVVRYLN